MRKILFWEDIKSVFNEIKLALKLKINESADRCPNCSTPYLLNEIYCYRCGEKKINKYKEATIYALIKEFFVEILIIDNKLIVTLALLLFRPGILSRAHYLGIKNRFLKPITILSISVTSFYLFFPKATLFNTGYDEFVSAYQSKKLSTSNLFHYNLAQKSQTKSEGIHKEVNYIVDKMNNDSYDLSKNLFWFIWPLWTLLIWLLLKKYHNHYGYHFIFSANIFGTYLVWWLLIAAIVFGALRKNTIPSIYTLYLNIAFTSFVILSIKNAYKLNYKKSALLGILLSFSFYALIILFRQIISLISFWYINN